MKMFKISLAKHCQKKGKSFKIKLIKSIKIFPKKRKSKSGNMVANIKIFQKMKSKNY